MQTHISAFLGNASSFIQPILTDLSLHMGHLYYKRQKGIASWQLIACLWRWLVVKWWDSHCLTPWRLVNNLASKATTFMAYVTPNGHLDSQFFIIMPQLFGVLKQWPYMLLILALFLVHLHLQDIKSFINGRRLSVGFNSRRQTCHFLFLLWGLLDYFLTDEVNCWCTEQLFYLSSFFPLQLLDEPANWVVEWLVQARLSDG